MEPKMAGRTAEQVNRNTRTDHSNGARELHTSGFVAGTLIMTAEGELPVEYLNPGDRIVSRNRGLVRLQGIHQSSDILEPVHMSAHALGSSVFTHRSTCFAAQLAGEGAARDTSSGY